jgi:two-component system sensor histidine kinase KdpD
VSQGLPLVWADYVLLEQAVGNVLLNAATHTPHGSTVIVSTRVSAVDVTLEISDNGVGIKPEDIERIFDMFYRPAAARPGGSGLGLHIVKGFIEAQGGKVFAANRTEGGSCFSIVLPLLENAVPMEVAA